MLVGCILDYKKLGIVTMLDEITSLFRFLSTIYSFILKGLAAERRILDV